MADLNFASAVGGLGNVASFLNLALDVNALVNPSSRVREGRRLSQLQILASRSGTPIPRVFGRMRVGGQLIWNATPQEVVRESGGDKGGRTRTPRQRSYHYTLSFAVGLCRGQVNHIGRIWADGKLIEQSSVDYKLHNGDADQEADPTITSAMGAGFTPAYRGLAYIVFQDFNLTTFGNRIPQLTFEVFCPTQESGATTQAITLLPGATEFGYHPEPHVQILGIAHARSENLNASWSRSDWDLSIDALQTSHPQCRDVSLVVAWFGDSLEAGACRLRPKVENHEKITVPTQWVVAGVGRGAAQIVSKVDGRPAFGGTPSDGAVIAAIKDLRARGFRVLFYPFIMMDIATTYPWRGRITSAATNATQITADIEHFVNGNNTRDLYCLRGMVRHYANLCAKAGGVDAFLIGSEMRGLSRLRTSRNTYPFAQSLVPLAQIVNDILPDTKISYAADWSEYGAYVPPTEIETGSVEFPLDVFWGNDVCDFIGIDAYFPLADWRDSTTHKDSAAGEITNPDYLRDNMAAGEYYDWYYADDVARDNQNRTPITDGNNEAWLYRAKDVRNWWGNVHRPRHNNVASAPTDWLAASKPIWFTEIGCPAVDKGANQPNVFPDRLSSEGGVPHYSNGLRDDHIQQAYLQAFTSFYEAPANNPISPHYHAPMVPRTRMYFWAWDARPFPTFPYRTDIWTDGGNWHTGHWLNGRQAVTPLTALITAIAQSGGETPQLENVIGVLDGYAVDRVMSPRNALAPLLEAYGLDALSSGRGLRITGRHNRAITHIDDADILPTTLTIIYADRATLTTRLDVHYINADSHYEAATATARASDAERPVQQVVLPLVLSSYVAEAIASRLLYEARLAGVRVQLHLPPRYLFLEVGDIIRTQDMLWRITRLNIVRHIEIEAVAYDAALYSGVSARALPPVGTEEIEIAAPPVLQIMDLPYLPQLQAEAGQALLAATATPWLQAVLVLDDNDRWQHSIVRPAVMGRTLETFAPAPIGRYDKHTTLEVELYYGTLHNYPLLQILAGRNLLAMKTSKGWEVLHFTSAELIGENHYRLSGFVRGIKGTQAYMDEPLATHAAFVLLDEAVSALENPHETLPHNICVSYGVSGLPQDSYVWQSGCFTHRRVGLRPLSPVHVKHIKIAGKHYISWIRRSRIQGDDFDAVEIPLGETREHYRLRIMAGGRELYRVETDTTQYHYPDTLYNVHTRHTPLQIHIAQISATQGAGQEVIFTLN
ncbi:MAG: hypothetical protein HAW65_00940 [Alphaproteobacteria bacterium]|nr:hypothetical protein [Alphaproteobacteria bacterium]